MLPFVLQHLLLSMLFRLKGVGVAWIGSVQHPRLQQRTVFQYEKNTDEGKTKIRWPSPRVSTADPGWTFQQERWQQFGASVPVE